jgi:hypothetical protein
MALLRGSLRELGRASSVEVFFQYRRRQATTELYEEDEPWKETPPQSLAAPSAFSAEAGGLRGAETYEIRAVVRHPMITIYGDLKPLGIPK